MFWPRLTRRFCREFSYDSLSRRTALNRPNGVNTTYAYDSLSRLLNVLHKAGTVTLDGAGYAYDSAGNRTAKTNYLNNITEQYTYDPTYQLTQVTQGATTTESYSYDAVGNRLSSLGMSSYAYNSSNELTSTTSATFTYDANGNTLTKSNTSGTTQYAWDFENRLKSVIMPSGTVTFAYDAFGRRIQKAFTQNSTTTVTNYLYDGANTIEEVDSAGNLLGRYAQGTGIDEPLAELRSGANAFYEADGLGSISSLSSPTGTISISYTYDTFGNATLNGSAVNPYRFTARDYDPETGLQYSRARYYLPDTGRFLNEDPLEFGGGSLNFYRYVLNRPTGLTDPFGLWSIICPSFLPWCPGYQPTPPKPPVKKDPPKGVCVCSRPTRFNGGWQWANYTGLSHNWIKTSTKEAGLGPAGGGVPGAGAPDAIGSPTAINNHSGQYAQSGASYFTVTDVDEDCVNRMLEIGKPEGPFLPGINDCHTFVSNVLDACRTNQQQHGWIK